MMPSIEGQPLGHTADLSCPQVQCHEGCHCLIKTFEGIKLSLNPVPRPFGLLEY